MYSYHNHSTFSDGKNTPEEIVLAAIENGMLTIGFSDHGYTKFDLRYCMKDTAGYCAEITRLKEKYKNKIQIYLGIEEDAFDPVERDQFDYIIGSSHYFCKDNKYYPIDSNYEYFKECLKEFQYDVVAMAEQYYTEFCKYIAQRKPDVIGHFDLLTKFDELDTSLFLENKKYCEMAEKYVNIAAKSGCLFEVNTGAIARGLRTAPYPSEHLLHHLKKADAKLVLASDSHAIETLTFQFDETRKYLRDLGFNYAYALLDNCWEKYEL